MRFRLYADHLRDSHAKFSLVMAFNTLLSVLVIGLEKSRFFADAIPAGYCVYRAEHARVIIVPTHLAAKVAIEGEATSPEYIRIMGIHLTHLLYTYTPYNIGDRYKEFLAYVPAENWATVKTSLQQRIDQVGKLKISESFMPKTFTLLKDSFLVAGTTIRWASGQELTNDEIHIRYTYSITDGGFRVEEIRLLSPAEYNALLRDHNK